MWYNGYKRPVMCWDVVAFGRSTAHGTKGTFALPSSSRSDCFLPRFLIPSPAHRRSELRSQFTSSSQRQLCERPWTITSSRNFKSPTKCLPPSSQPHMPLSSWPMTVSISQCVPHAEILVAGTEQHHKMLTDLCYTGRQAHHPHQGCQRARSRANLGFPLCQGQ